MSETTPEQVLESIVDGINTGNLDALLTLYEPEAAFARQPGNLARGLAAARLENACHVEIECARRATNPRIFVCSSAHAVSVLGATADIVS